MNYLIKVTLLGLFFGTFGTTIGGIIGVNIKTKSNKLLSFILEFAAGLMMAIICFDLIPEAFETSSIITVFFGLLLGVFCMIFFNGIIQNKFNEKTYNSNSLLKTGILVAIGLAFHNFPEGIAIGSGFGASLKLGYSLAIAIAFHDVPEGIAMAVPMKAGGMDKTKVLVYTILSGVTTGIGALFGGIIGNISNNAISICLGFAAGAMLYIVSGELIPESKKLYKGRFAACGNILGFIIGLIATSL